MKPLKRMMNEYITLLEKYALDLKNFDIADYKKLIGEVKMFWYRNQRYVDYFLLILRKKIKLLSCGSSEIRYCKQWTFEFINITESDEYYSTLIDMSERIILSMFTVEYNDVQQLYGDNSSYEDIERKLLPHIREQLFFDDLKDIKLPLRDRCQKYINANGNIMPFVKKLSEAQLFYMAVSQYFMQALSIVVTMKNYHLIPFIRNDILFQYFSMIYHSNIMNEFSEQDYMNTYIPYVIQKAFDFSDRGYQHIKEHIGNGKMINAIMNSFEKGKIPLPNEIVKCIEAYMQCND